MKETTNMSEVGGIVVPESAMLRREPANPYGSVPGLDDDELADPAELERQVYRQELEPILKLPIRCNGGWVQPARDESGGLDWGAFGSVDFQRLVPDFDKARYKLDKLREELRDTVIMLEIVSDRVPWKARSQVLKHLRMGLIDLDHIEDPDMHAVGKWYLRARRIRSEIHDLKQARWARQRRQAET